MKSVIVVIVLVVAQSASARGEISKTYLEQRSVSQSESYDGDRRFLILQLRKEFAEYAIESIISGQTRATLTDVTDETYSYTLGRVRTEIIGE